MTLADLLFGLQLIQLLQQSLAPTFNRIFEAITLLGNDAVLVALCAIVYWCFDKRRGRLVTYVLFFGAYANFFLKILIPWPRPPVDVRLAEKTEMSYGFPSGHAQDSTTFWAWLSLDFRKRILPVLGTAIVAAVGVSRIYLGVHYPAQVIGGWVIGLAVVGAAMLVLRYLPAQKQNVQIGSQAILATAALVPLFVTALIGAVGEVNAGLIGGYLCGFSLGAIAEDRYVNFTTNIGNGKRIVRIVIGGAITVFFVFALTPILPETFLITSFVNSLIRGVAVVVLAPAVFKIVERG